LGNSAAGTRAASCDDSSSRYTLQLSAHSMIISNLRSQVKVTYPQQPCYCHAERSGPALPPGPLSIIDDGEGEAYSLGWTLPLARNCHMHVNHA